MRPLVLWVALLVLIGLALAFRVTIGTARGASPEGADPSLAPWFQGLTAPNGASCCSIADCRPVDSRIAGDHYEALTEQGWLAIPADKVIHPRTNPIGRAVLCRSLQMPAIIYCFAPAIEV